MACEIYLLPSFFCFLPLRTDLIHFHSCSLKQNFDTHLLAAAILKIHFNDGT